MELRLDSWKSNRNGSLLNSSTAVIDHDQIDSPAGRYNGRPPKIDREKVIDLATKQGLSNAQIAKELNISRGSVYNILYKWEEENGLLTETTRNRAKAVKKMLNV